MGLAPNVALFASLPQRCDLILADELIHASAHDGLRMTRADHMFAPPNDVNAFEADIRTWRAGGGKGRVWIAFETHYRMAGDMATISTFANIAEAEDAWLLMDEGQETGVHGPQGRGLPDGLEGQDNAKT